MNSTTDSGLSAAERRDLAAIRARQETARREQALVLANDALLQRQGRQAQVQRVRDGRVEALSVRLGLQGDSHSEVLDGLAEGDLLLAEPAQVGQQVRVRLLPGLAAEQE